LNKLIEFSLRQRLLTLLLVLMLAGAGVLAWSKLPIDAFPDVSGTQVKVIIKAPGLTPEEVEARITVPIEQELLGIPRQKMLRSTSKYALADITLDFEDGTDPYWARQQVNERLSGVMKDLPETASGGLAPITTPLGEMFMFTIEGPQSLEEKRRLLDWVIRPALRTTPGVADVNSLGGRVRTFEVVPDPAALQAQGISLDTLEQAIVAGHRNDGAGRLNQGDEALIVRSEGAMQTLDDVRDAVVRSEGGRITRVGDVAEVRLGELTRYGAVTRNGEGEAVQGLVLGLRGANAREVVAGVRARLEAIQPSLPKGVVIDVFYDRSKLVDRAVFTVSKALLEAVVLVVLLLLAFLGNVRAALVVALMLPLAALGTFVLMRWFGLSANLMSLGGLAIAIGMLVDGAVVVVENIEAHLARSDAHKHSILQVVARASREVVTPVTSGIAIIIIVFLPLLSLEGLEGKLFGPVALTIVFALAVSLILSLSLVPVLASWLLKEGHDQEPWLMRKLSAGYAPLLRWGLAHPRALMAGAGAALLLAVALFTQVGKTFMPTLDEGDLIVQLEKLPSIGLEATADLDLRVQREIMKRVPEVQGIVARSGADELGLDPMGLNQTDTFLVLKPHEAWREPGQDKEWLIGELRKVLEDFPGLDAGFTQPIDMRVSEMLTGVRGDVAIKIYGSDLRRLNAMATQVEGIISRIEGATDTLTLRNDGVAYLQVEIDRQAAGRLGLKAQDIQADLRRWVEGQTIGLIQESGRRTPLVIRGSEALRHSPVAFESLRIVTPDGQSVALSSVARLRRTDGPVKIDRELAQRYVVVQTNVRGRDLVGFVEEARRKVEQAMPLPEGHRITWGGQFENQQRAAQRLMLVVPVALLLIFFLLFSTFGSVRQAALVLSNVPLALIGGITALAVTGQYLSVPASVGFIALLGIAVLNGVVMVSHFNQLIEEGRNPRQAVLEGAQRRLRPVLMTAAITAGGLIPLLFATGPGSEIQRPLAIVVIGGLLTSTALTLLLLPMAYERFGVNEEAPA
jgi:cobalt-zinc-cadmium resistance protein CzcA